MSDSPKIDPQVITDLQQGKVIAYPTEAVFGLGCDPDNLQAVNKILTIKQRPVSKGLILVAADVSQLSGYIDFSPLSQTTIDAILASWPGPNTWVVPAGPKVEKWISGEFETVAVRVSAHPVVQQLCRLFGKPLVSTSANLSGQPAINEIAQLHSQLSGHVDHIVPGDVDPNRQPSTIIDALSGVVYRS